MTRTELILTVAAALVGFVALLQIVGMTGDEIARWQTERPAQPGEPR